MIAVIGAGPAGCYYASRVRGREVHLFEEHQTVGQPVSCTGILTDSVRRVIGEVPERLVVSRIRRFKLVAPGGRFLYVDLDKVNLILDRAAFDRYLLDQALANGAVLHLGERFLGYTPTDGGGYEVHTTRGDYRAHAIVGADGPESPVARAAGLYRSRSFVRGLQARCRFPGLEDGVTEIRLALGEFSWIVPEDGQVARVGVIGPDGPSLHRDYAALLGNAEIMEDQGGLIPLFDPRQKLRKPGENVFLIGDAATQVKATTYGGIIYGLLAAQYLAENPETYESRMAAKLGRDLWISLRMREFMNAMTEQQADELLEIFQRDHNKQIITQHDRDFPSRFIVQLLMKEAQLWKLGWKLLRTRARGGREGATRLAS
ncbi:MAG TPA: NAD(P)/FAD-dependent oxidoreductase [Spirochaetia bacterium]|nr:NAD(P)/FAD-dependent oxidoreductase [Spirochaetia bacterium]